MRTLRVRAAMLLFPIVGGTACGGDIPGSPQSPATTARATSPTARHPRVTPAEFRRMNPVEGVGRIHREGMQSFSAGMRSGPKGKATPLCPAVIENALRTVKRNVPSADPASLVASAKAGLRYSRFCQSKRAAITQTSMPQGGAESPEYLALADSVLLHVSAASDLTDLSSRLAAVLSAAPSRLADTNEVIAIQSIVAVAYDSFEYNYQNATYTQAIDDFAYDYGDCLQEHPELIEVLDPAAAQVCVGVYDESAMRRSAFGQVGIRWASMMLSPGRNPHCEWGDQINAPTISGTLWKHAKRVAGADALGAFGGFIKGALFGPAIGPSIAAGAIVGSSVALGEIAYHGYMCMLSVE